MVVSSYDAETGKREKNRYTPLFSSDSMKLTENSEFRVSIVITKRVEPITHTFLQSFGALGPGDLNSSATAVIHFVNFSNDEIKVVLKSMDLFYKDENLNLIEIGEIILSPQESYSTEEIETNVFTYSKEFEVLLNFDINGENRSQKFQMKRQTIEDVKKKK